MNNKGYFYTLITVMLVFMIFSITLFYFKVSKPKMIDIITNIQTDELHFFIESIKKDFSRAMIISGQRAAAFLINEDQPLEGYYYQNYCGGLDYVGGGTEAALAELIYCGTFEGSDTESGPIMENYTVVNWTERIIEFADTLGFVLELNVTSLEVLPFGAFKFAVVGHMEIFARDKNNISFFTGEFPSIAVVPITMLSDPLSLFQTGEYGLLRNFTPCIIYSTADASVVDGWIDNECYFSSNKTYNASSFFDRLDNNTNLSEVYQQQAEDLAAELGNPNISIIGLETLLDPDRIFENYSIPVDIETTWVDYLYWQNIRGICTVEGMVHSNLHIDPEHALKYNITGLNCDINITNTSTMADIFDPYSIEVPVGTNVTWRSDDDWDSKHELWNDTDLLGNVYLGGLPVWYKFDAPGVYNFWCNSHGSGGPYEGRVNVLDV